jgi:hypothetical protein
MPPHCLRGPRQRTESHGLVFRIEQAIELSAACLHARGELGLGNFLTPHQFVKLPHQHALDSPRGYALVDSVLLQEVIEGRSNSAFLAGCFLDVISFFRLIANSRSPAGVFCVSLIKACSNIILPSCSQNSTRAIRPCVNVLRTSHNPRPKDRQSGMPIGQANSTSLMSSPTILRSSEDKPLSHSRTGSRPEGTA